MGGLGWFRLFASRCFGGGVSGWRKVRAIADNDEEMLQTLLPLLPAEAGAVAMAMAGVGMLIGLVLWLAGARYSRSIVTLLMVTIGAGLGLRLPGWFGWPVSGMGAAVGGAMSLGLIGFLLHRLWVGLGLGWMLAAWGALLVWTMLGQGQTWQVPAEEATTLGGYAASVWEAMPDDFTWVAPFVCAAAMLTGLSIGWIWPRMGVVLLYSVMGVSLLVATGLAAIEFGRPEWLSHVPSQTAPQVMLLTLLVAFGAVVQWKASPARPETPVGPPKEKKN